jgi:hypothetical protein
MAFSRREDEKFCRLKNAGSRLLKMSTSFDGSLSLSRAKLPAVRIPRTLILIALDLDLDLGLGLEELDMDREEAPRRS